MNYVLPQRLDEAEPRIRRDQELFSRRSQETKPQPGETGGNDEENNLRKIELV